MESERGNYIGTVNGAQNLRPRIFIDPISEPIAGPFPFKRQFFGSKCLLIARAVQFIYAF